MSIAENLDKSNQMVVIRSWVFFFQTNQLVDNMNRICIITTNQLVSAGCGFDT